MDKKTFSSLKESELKEYFTNEPEVLFAFLFGSWGTGLKTEDSDIDIAVYFKSLKRGVEWQEERDYPREKEMWSDLVDMFETDNVDLVVLNRAYPVLASSIVKDGRPLVVKNENLFLEFCMAIDREAEDFSDFMEDYFEIKISSKSLNPEVKSRLLLRFDYLLTYWSEKDKFSKLDFATYTDNLDQRRNIERWVENISNATIDIAKIILASEKKQMPKSYKAALLDFGFFFGLNEKEAREFSEVANLRNILAHEYLDILYKRIRDFLIDISPLYERLINFLKNYMQKNSIEEGR